MQDRTQHVIDAIDGALADDEWPDAMRWSPEPEQVAAPAPFDGRHVPLPQQQYEREHYDGDRVPARTRRLIEAAERRSHDYSQTPLAELEEAGRRILASGRPPQVVVRGPAADELVVDDDGGLTPVWVMVQRRPMARPPLSHHWSGLALDLNVNPAGWAALTERLREDAAHRDRELAQQREAFARAFAGIAEGLRPVFDAVRQIAESMGTSMGELVRSLEALKAPEPLRPPIELRARDPRQYALELRQTRSTGPSRPNAQNARRPRRHQQ